MSIKPDFCFFHIEKCMGSSLRIMLYDYFINIYKKEQIFVPEKCENIGQNLTIENDMEYFTNFNFKVILCHCSYNYKNITDSFSEKCFSITCVRNPIQRFLSHYNFFEKNKFNCNFFELEDEDIIKLLNDCENLLTFRLSGETKNINDAINNLKKINCILITEKINDDIINLNTLLNKFTKTNNKINIVYENVNKTDGFLDKDLIHIQKYIKYFENDIYLYNYINNMTIDERFK